VLPLLERKPRLVCLKYEVFFARPVVVCAKHLTAILK
jgi:hypothetical protein